MCKYCEPDTKSSTIGKCLLNRCPGMLMERSRPSIPFSIKSARRLICKGRPVEVETTKPKQLIQLIFKTGNSDCADISRQGSIMAREKYGEPRPVARVGKVKGFVKHMVREIESPRLVTVDGLVACSSGSS